jgi:uncharacterized RDD family membrane protein YckC
MVKATPGKQFFGIIVVNEDGKALTFGQDFARGLVKCFEVVFCNIIASGFDAKVI